MFAKFDAISVSLALIASLVASIQPGDARWIIDSAHTKATFTVKYGNIVPITGWFGDVNGEMGKKFNPSDPTTASDMNVTITTTSLATGNPMRDMHLKKGQGFFEVEKYPVITFKAKSVKRTGPNTFNINGDLTIHNVTKPVTLQATGPSKALKLTDSGYKIVAATAKTKLNRQDFKINWNRDIAPGVKMVGDDVDVTLEVTAIDRGQ